jgi:hypothetical protein
MELLGILTVKGGRADDGHRDYVVTHLVKGTVYDGPANVMRCPGLPLAGTVWLFSNDLDMWAYCKLGRTAEIHEEREGDPAEYWRVESNFSSRPDAKSCKDDSIEDPLLQPPRISGGFTKYNREAVRDRFGRHIRNSSHEQLRGQQVEFEESGITISIEQNVAVLNLGLLAQFNNTVNAYTLWGAPPRTIRLTVGPWERKFYGTCYVYFSRKLDFEVNWEGWDRDILDEGNRVLFGHWSKVTGEWVTDPIDEANTPPDSSNPSHFETATDRAGNPCHVILDGAGKPVSRTGPVGLTGTVDGVLDNNIEKRYEVSISSDAHGLVSGDRVMVTGMLGPVTLNLDINDKAWFIEVLSADTFTLKGSVKQIGGVPIAGASDSTFYWIQGGTWAQLLNTVPGCIHVEKYAATDFLLLGGVPTDLNG